MASAVARRASARRGLVAVVSGEPTSDRPAGPGLRARGIAAGLTACGLSAVVRDLESGPAVAIEEADVVIVNLSVAVRAPGLLAAPYVVVDAAGPFLVESLWVNADRRASERRGILVHESERVGRVLAAADLVLVAQEAQRSLVLGLLLGRGSIRPELLDRDPALERLIAVVPFAVEDGGARREHAPGAEEGSELSLVWPGGLWDWLDPGTLVRAVAVARARGTRVTLELWGTRSPDPEAPTPRGVESIRRQIAALGLGDAVSLVDWIPYEEVPARLALFDLAVTLDPGGVEARFAYRTRLVQALACGVPTLATGGEAVADRAAADGCGWTVAPGDVDEVAALLVSLATDRARLERARRKTTERGWGEGYADIVGPLAAFCAEPRRQRPGPPPRRIGRRLRRLVRTVAVRTSL